MVQAQGAKNAFNHPGLDFSGVRQFKPGTHPGLLLVRLREPGANALLSRIQAVIQAEGLDSIALFRGAHGPQVAHQAAVIETLSHLRIRTQTYPHARP
jgi:hypothetical protein